MDDLLRRYRIYLAVPLLAVFIVTAWLVFDVRDLCAHSPHDPIDDIAVSPTYARDQTVFIVVLDQLLRSTDGGLSWKQLVKGLEHRGFLSAVEISPFYGTDKTAFVASRGDGIYRSRDGGNSWVKASQGLGTLDIRLLSIQAASGSAQLVLAAGAEGGLYRTDDSGDHWHQVMDQDIKITALASSPGPQTGQAFAGDSQGVLYRSEDEGETWRTILALPDAGAIQSIVLSPVHSGQMVLFIGTGDTGVFKSVDGGGSFTQVNSGLPFSIRDRYGTFRTSAEGPLIRRSETDVLSVALSPDYPNDSTVFVATWNQAIFRSTDGGDSWNRFSLGLTCSDQADSGKHRSPHFREIKMSDGFAVDQAVFLGGFDGLFKSTDGGRHWVQLETFPVSLVAGLDSSVKGSSSEAIAITTYGGGAYATTDRGRTWAVLNRGLGKTRLTDIAFVPSSCTDQALMSAVKGYLLRSTCDGEGWEGASLGYLGWRRRASGILKRVGVPAFLAQLLLTESERDKPYPTVFAFSPDFASDGTMFFGTRDHGIFRSADGGRSASLVWDGLGQLITSLAISPDFESDGTLYAGVYGAGVYRSTDRGNTWESVNNGLSFVELWKSTVTENVTRRQSVWLAISPNYGLDQTVFAGGGEGLFKTIDGGTSWQELEVLQDGLAYVFSLAISPDYRNDETLILSVKGRGLFKTMDGGNTFAPIGLELIDGNYLVQLIEFSNSYATDRTTYAASDEELFVSTDGGSKWDRVSRPVRYEDDRDVLRYEGTWETSSQGDYSADSVTYSDVFQSKVVLRFVGTGVEWVGAKSQDAGIAQVFVDGQYVGDVDQFNETKKARVTSFTVKDLEHGPHTIAIQVSAASRPESTGARIYIDAFDVVP